MTAHELVATAKALVAPGKGILAADESFPTIERRFKSIDVASTQETRRAYREMLFTTPGVGEFLSGAILFDETLRDRSDAGTPFPEVLAGQGIMAGMKVDTGAKALPACPGEKITEGLDGLGERLADYRALGARFTKWRAVITIGAGIPSETCIRTNAQALARFAVLSQDAGLVPIVEPEVLMDGEHTIERCYEVTLETLHTVFHELFKQRVAFEGMLLKPNMVLSGTECAVQASVQEVAEATVRCLSHTVPAAMPGVVFLSGGQSDVVATRHLNAMNAMQTICPWQLSFSYGRALQGPTLQAWKGDATKVPAAQQAFYHRAKCNGSARYGRYTAAMEQAATTA